MRFARLPRLRLASIALAAVTTACGDPEPGAGESSTGSSGSASGSGSTTATDASASTTVSTTTMSTTDEGSSGGSDGTSAADSGGDSSSSGGIPTEPFSFFVTSLRAMQELSGSEAGFGGDLRFGETGPGAGLRGADLICGAIADRSMPGASAKGWRAFLSATDDGNGNVVHAIDRVGEGPWYDRLGRVLALKKADLMAARPTSADPAIINDFPNEDGVPNHAPDPGKGQVDNHDMLTGSNTEGKLYAASATCLDWTGNKGDTATEGKPRVGHSWPRGGGGGPGGDSGAHWMSSLTESGCAPGVNLIEQGGPKPNEVTVVSGGGYGGFYCFALTP